MSTISICLFPFVHDTSLFAIGMDFAHRYINMRRIVYVYILIDKNISNFLKMRGEENYPGNFFNESFVSLIFEYGQRVFLHARVLSIVMNGVYEAVTDGSLR